MRFAIEKVKEEEEALHSERREILKKERGGERESRREEGIVKNSGIAFFFFLVYVNVRFSVDQGKVNRFYVATTRGQREERRHGRASLCTSNKWRRYCWFVGSPIPLYALF